MSAISKQEAPRPLVLTLDVGSSSLRASLYDGLGHALSGLEIKSNYQLDTTPDGGVEKDPSSNSRCRNRTEAGDCPASVLPPPLGPIQPEP